MDFEQRSNEKQFHNKRHRFLNKYILLYHHVYYGWQDKKIKKYLWNQGLGRPLMCPNFFLEPLHHPFH